MRTGVPERFKALVSYIDERLARRSPSNLGFRYRNDKKFQTACDEALRLYREINKGPKITINHDPHLARTIERFQNRYRREIEVANEKYIDAILQNLGHGPPADAPEYDDDLDHDEKIFIQFDENHHKPVTVLNYFIDYCWNISCFDEEETPEACQKLILAEGATRHIEERLGLDIDGASSRFRDLETFHVDPSLINAAPNDWRRADKYLQQAITAYTLNLHLCAIGLARPLIDYILRNFYAPILRPDVDIENEEEKCLIRKIQATKKASWIHSYNGEFLFDSASKVLHFKYFDEFKAEYSTEKLARELLIFLRTLLHQMPR